MIGLIAKKDFLLNLLSVRFMIGFVLCLLIIPFTIVVGMDGYLNQMRIYKIDQAASETGMNQLQAYSFLRPQVVSEPQVLSIFSNGISNNVGNKVKVNLGEIPLFPEGHASSRDNPLLNAFFSIDFATVIAIVISLLALVFAYDTITREREDGTMKLAFTGQVSRISFLFGKLLGLLLTLLPILLFCYLLACLILVLNPDIRLTATDWGGVMLLFLTSVVYMLVFALLGMFISALTSHSSSAIIVSLLCWISFVFLVPNMSVYLSQSIVRMPLYDNVQLAMSAYDDAFRKERNVKEQQLLDRLGMKGISHWNHYGGMDGGRLISGGAHETVAFYKEFNTWQEPTRIAYADKKWALQKDYLDQLIRQHHVQQWISWISPSELFGQAAEALCQTHVDAFLSYMDSQRKYRETIIRYLTNRDLFASARYITDQREETYPTQQEIEDFQAGRGGRSAEPKSEYFLPAIDTQDIPRYVPQQPTVGSAFGAALGRLTALLGLVVALLLGTIGVFMKYDVR